MAKEVKYTNQLSKETSPYLLQHAHNPVNWVAWSEKVFEDAKNQDKLVLISVGYSACHWCHVMEHESFEDEEVAAIMNKHFICVKVDREERPDVDQVYMTAVQLMTQQGGWPLNCFTLPDGRPVYGGTYFPKEQWMHILNALEQTYRIDNAKVLDYAAKLHDGINQSELIKVNSKKSVFSNEKLTELVQRWSRSFDMENGGPTRAPKFMLPSNFEFLLRYGHQFNDQKVLDYTKITLDKMAMGGIYDQIEGGFSRYSVDMLWKVPHFEKMLYDNGQLLSLYANAYQKFKSPLYKRIVYQTVDWLQRKMYSVDNLFYSALDADSEGEEGKFYVWKKDELKDILENDYDFASAYFDFTNRAVWEENLILLRTKNDKESQALFRLTENEFDNKVEIINEKLRLERELRISPATDDKCLTSWNAMTIVGLCIASRVFNEKEFEILARKTMLSLLDKMSNSDGSVNRNYKNGRSNIKGFLEDYAHLIAALLHLYKLTFETKWLDKAGKFLEFTKKNFQDPDTGLYYFTQNDTELISRKMEIQDNVIPASNSVMANNLFLFGQLTDQQEYIDEAKSMLNQIYDDIEQYGSGYSNWAVLLLNLTQPYYQIKISGNYFDESLMKIGNEYLPNYVIKKDNTNSGKNNIMICTDHNCIANSNDTDIIEFIKTNS